MTGTEHVAESVGDVPVCEGCGLAGRMHFDTGICPDCFNRRNGWQGGGQTRVVTSGGTYHETALCPGVRQASVWWHWSDEACMHSELGGDLDKCIRCHSFSLYGLDEYTGDDDRQVVIGHA